MTKQAKVLVRKLTSRYQRWSDLSADPQADRWDVEDARLDAVEAALDVLELQQDVPQAEHRQAVAAWQVLVS